MIVYAYRQAGVESRVSDVKAEFYRLLTHLEAAQVQLESLECLGPIEDWNGRPLLIETEAEKERLRKVIAGLSPRLARLERLLNA